MIWTNFSSSFHFCNFVIKRAGRGEGSQKTEQTKSNEEHGIEGDQRLDGKFRQSLRQFENNKNLWYFSKVKLTIQHWLPPLQASTSVGWKRASRVCQEFSLHPTRYWTPVARKSIPCKSKASLRDGGQPGSVVIRKMFPLLQKKLLKPSTTAPVQNYSQFCPKTTLTSDLISLDS